MWLDGSTHLVPDPQENFGATNSYPVQIARAMAYIPHNHAIGGGSNDAMFRIWQAQCDQLCSADIVIACWTGRHRSEIWHEHDQLWIQISPGTESYLTRVPDTLFLEGRCVAKTVTDQSSFLDYTKSWQVFANDVISAENNKIKNIHALNALAERRGIRVLNFDSFDPIDHPDVGGYEWPSPTDFMAFAHCRGFRHTINGHYFLDAHTAYADLAMETLRG